MEIHVGADEEDALLGSDLSDGESRYGPDSSAAMTASSLHDSVTERLEQLALLSLGRSTLVGSSKD